MYAVGFTPWERHGTPELLRELAEVPAALPPGRALDAGCGRGAHSVYLARQGWKVTGVELVPSAVAAARRRAKEAGVEVDFREGDVTMLRALEVAADIDLVFDFGCFHSLSSGQKRAYAGEISALTAPNAVMLMMAFTKPTFGVVPEGVTEELLRSTFGPRWKVTWVRSDPDPGPTAAMRRSAAGWFRLDRS